MPWRSSSLQYRREYCCFVIAPIHRKMRYLKVRCNLKRRAEYFIVKRLPALRIPRDKQTQMSVFALTVQGAMSLRLVRKIAADARQSPQAIQLLRAPAKKGFCGKRRYLRLRHNGAFMGVVQKCAKYRRGKGFNAADVAILPALNQVQAVITRLNFTPRRRRCQR